MDKKNTIKIYTTSNGAELNISAPSSKQIISATNNRAQYFAEQAMKYRDEAKEHRDNAKYYSEQNSDVTLEYINNVKIGLENKISEKQNAGNYALKDEVPTMIGELENNVNFIKKEEVEMKIENIKLPTQEGNEGKFLMADGEKGSWKNITVFQLFDTKISDSILQGDSAKGWALQGTYVNGVVYPDFYAKCLEEYNEATTTEQVNGVTVKVNSNGHKFYDIADKTAIDEFYNSLGSAWFYGVDTENERIFLPRDKYFAVTGNVSVAGNGTTLGLTDGDSIYGLTGITGSTVNRLVASSGGYGTDVGTAYSGAPVATQQTYGVTLDPEKSGIKGYLTANEDRYLYICVGNTIVNEDKIDASKILNEAVLRSSLEKCEVIIETYKNGTSWYRVWSDGWCEQGGVSSVETATTTISLLKTFKDTSYNLSMTGSAGYPFITSRAVDFFVADTSAAATVDWQASGYIW